MAIPYLEGKRPIKLLVIGGDDQSPIPRENLRNLTKELGISDHVTFLGFVNHEELPIFYSAADVCVIPSYHESFGLVALESLACGTPVVATKVGAMESVIRSGHTGYVVDDNTPVLLAGKIVRLLSGVSKTRKPINVIRASVLQFSWSHVAEAVEREYASVLKRYLTKG
jgi:D-inositol-3-phosphate glycosyltransferase